MWLPWRVSLVRGTRQGSFVFVCLSTRKWRGGDNVRLSLPWEMSVMGDVKEEMKGESYRYKHPAHGTVRSACGTQTAGATSSHRSWSTASVGSASVLQARRPGLRGGLSLRSLAPALGRPAAPDGSHAPGAPGRCGGDAVGL